MDNSAESLGQFIKDARRILITSHISPDPDAISSALLLTRTLEVNYPDKKIVAALEERPNRDLSFLTDYEKIRFGPLNEVTGQFSPELFIIVDANKFDRVSRLAKDQLAEFIAQNGVKTAVIDHHEPHDLDQVDVYINNHFPASSQEVYDLCFNRWRLSKPGGYAETTLIGIITDTYRFKYKNPRHRETFRLVSDLIDAGADIEQLDNRLEHYAPGELKVVAELAVNFSSEANYNFSFVSDEFVDSWRGSGVDDDFKSATELFTNQFLRNTGSNRWGFIVNQELSEPGKYHVSFRAAGDIRDVSIIASTLGGGGHKPAAGAKFVAVSIEDAIDKVKAAIEQAS